MGRRRWRGPKVAAMASGRRRARKRRMNAALALRRAASHAATARARFGPNPALYRSLPEYTNLYHRFHPRPVGALDVACPVRVASRALGEGPELFVLLLTHTAVTLAAATSVRSARDKSPPAAVPSRPRRRAPLFHLSTRRRRPFTAWRPQYRALLQENLRLPLFGDTPAGAVASTHGRRLLQGV